MLPVFRPSCKRYAAHFTAVGDAIDTTAWVNAARLLDVGVGTMLPNLLPLVPRLTLQLG